MSQVRILSPRPLIFVGFFHPHLPAVPDTKGSRFQKRFQFQGRKISRNFGCPWMPTDGMNRWPPVVWGVLSSRQVPMVSTVLDGSQHSLRMIRRALSFTKSGWDYPSNSYLRYSQALSLRLAVH